METKVWEQGILFVILAALGFAIWRTIGWAAQHIVIPAVESHIQFLKVVSESIQAQTELIEKIDNQLEGLYSVLGKDRDPCCKKAESK